VGDEGFRVGVSDIMRVLGSVGVIMRVSGSVCGPECSWFICKRVRGEPNQIIKGVSTV
jgi:hypothetical protein